jgi:hypothetical protein
MTSVDTTIAAVPASVREKIRTWALIALILYVANGAAFAGFSAAGGAWATVSDSVALLLAIALLALVAGFDKLFRPSEALLSRTAYLVGVTSMSLAIVGSIVLLTSPVSHEFVPAEGGLGLQFAGWGLLGVWFLLIGVIGVRTAMFSRRWVWVSYLAGAGSVIAMLATIPLGADSPVVSIGFTIAFLAIVAWVIRTRKELSAG